MADNDENKAAREAQEAEMRKIGVKPHSERVAGGDGDDDEEDSDLDEEEDEDTDNTEEDDNSEDEEEDSDDENEEESDDEDDEEEDEEEDSQSHKKKGIPYKVYNDQRKDLRAALKTIEKLTTANSEKVEDVPDDFDTRIEALAKEIGVENPDGLKKIMALVKNVIKGSETNFEKKLAEMEQKYGKKLNEILPIEDQFSKEWKSFQKTSFSKDFPNATADQIEAAQELMNQLSHTRGVGGKVYKDSEGRELLDPYELDYIYFKNKDQFSEILEGKKSRGMEKNRSQKNLGGKDNERENKPLRKGASATEIRDYEKRSAKFLEGIDNLSEPVDDTI